MRNKFIKPIGALAIIAIAAFIFVYAMNAYNINTPVSGQPAIISSSPTPTITPAMNCSNIIYTVTENDTLSSIANNFGVSEESIKKANNLNDDVVFTGMHLNIELCGEPTTPPQVFPTGTPVLDGLTPLYVPNGQWRFVSYNVPDSNSSYTYVLAYVERLDSTHRIVIQDDWKPSGLGFAYPNTYWWTDDGKSLYVADFGFPDGCGYFGYGGHLQKVDLETEEVIPVATGVVGSFSVSPDGRMLAYLKAHDVIFRNLDDGAERTAHFDVPSENFQAGGINWSPSSDRIIFDVVNNACSSETTFGTFTIRPGDTSAAMAIPFSQTRYVFESWKKGEMPVLTGPDTKRYALDLDKLELRTYP